ncbi:MAG TPA: hypothetical protein VE404_10180 [Verrucomicrobiae bacterium]|nr:hypothetical protein [Verrucomicrobiae bacterium]
MRVRPAASLRKFAAGASQAPYSFEYGTARRPPAFSSSLRMTV